jgi:hypothetical protein
MYQARSSPRAGHREPVADAAGAAAVQRDCEPGPAAHDPTRSGAGERYERSWYSPVLHTRAFWTPIPPPPPSLLLCSLRFNLRPSLPSLCAASNGLVLLRIFSINQVRGTPSLSARGRSHPFVKVLVRVLCPVRRRSLLCRPVCEGGSRPC